MNSIESYLSSVYEGFLINEKDIQLNLELWKPGPHHVLFITGLSGSGKTTLAEEYEKKYHAQMFEMDGIEHGYDSSKSDIIKRCAANLPKYNEYLQHYDEPNAFSRYKEAIWDAFDYAMNWIVKDRSQLWIVEGIQIFDFFYPENIKGEPLIIKGTSTIMSAIRASKRDNMRPVEILDQIWKRVKSDKQLGMFKKEMKS